MNNDYFNNSAPVGRNTKARSAEIRGKFDAIAAGFGKLPSKDDLEQGKTTFAVAEGSANTYTASMPATLTAYAVAQHFRIQIPVTNTGASTLNVDGLGARAIKRIDGTDVEAGDLTQNDIVDFVYNGTSMVLMGAYRSHLAGMASNLGADLVFSGNPTFSGSPRFTGNPVFSDITNKAGVRSALGLGILDSPSFSGLGVGTTAPDVRFHVVESSNANTARIENRSGIFASKLLQLDVDRAASPDWVFLDCWSGGFGDLELRLTGNGDLQIDGALSSGGADYAEFHEWMDGNPGNEDRRGLAVFLVGGKIREALEGEEPIGVVSGNPSVIGDNDMDRWQGKYLRDDFGSYILEDYQATDQETGQKVTLQRRVLNPNYDPSKTYVPRRERPEWDFVGTEGKLRLRKGQHVAPRWIKMRDISEHVEEWLVR